MINVVIYSENPAFKADLENQIKNLDGYSADVSLEPDILVLDEDTTKLAALKQKYDRVPIFVLLKKGDKKQQETPFIRYITKPFALNMFLDSMQSALSFVLMSNVGILKFGGYELCPLEKELKNLKTSERIKLTEREVSMLLHLYKAKNNITTKTDFLREVWGYSPDVSTHTIETHVYRLRQKVEKNKNWPELIVTENGGYKLHF